jgi:hypothetical protein
MAPLFRGSVHTWAQTVIQAMVALGGIVLVVEAMRSKGVRKRSSRSRDSLDASSDGSDGGRTGSGSVSGSVSGSGSGSFRNRKGFTSRELFLYVAGPCAALGVWSAVMSPHPALAVQGLIMLVTCLGFFFLVTASVRTRGEQRALVWVIAGTAGFLCVTGLLELYDVLVFSWWDICWPAPW